MKDFRDDYLRMKKDAVLLNFYFITVLVCIFRLPVFAIFKLYNFAYLFNLVPLIVLVVFFFYNKDLSDKKTFWNKFFLLSLFILFFSILYRAITIGQKPTISLIKVLGSTSFFVITPLILYNLKINRENFKELLFKISKAVFVISIVYIFSEYIAVHVLSLFTARDLKLWLYSENAHFVPQVVRVAGFQITSAYSALALLSSWAFLLNQTTIGINNKVFWGKKDKDLFTLIFVGIIAIILCDSIVALLISIFILANFLILNKKNVKLSYLGICLLIFVSTVCATPIGERIWTYLATDQFSLAHHAPNFSNCSLKILTIGDTPRPDCTTAEIHSLLNLFKYGFLNSYGWFFLLIWPIIVFLKNVKISNLKPALFASLCFSLSTIHYSGAEAWGLNYLFITYFVGVVKHDL